MAFDDRTGRARRPHPGRIPEAKVACPGAHARMLRIVRHQTAELRMRPAIRELSAAHAATAARRLPAAFRRPARAARIFGQMTGARDVPRMRPPPDPAALRARPGQCPGFRSAQHRRTRFTAGDRDPATIRPHVHRAGVAATPEAECARPSPAGTALAAPARAGQGVPAEIPRRDLRPPPAPHPRLRAAWPGVGRDTRAQRALCCEPAGKMAGSRTISAAGASTASSRSGG